MEDCVDCRELNVNDKSSPTMCTSCSCAVIRPTTAMKKQCIVVQNLPDQDSNVRFKRRRTLTVAHLYLREASFSHKPPRQGSASASSEGAVSNKPASSSTNITKSVTTTRKNTVDSRNPGVILKESEVPVDAVQSSNKISSFSSSRLTNHRLSLGAEQHLYQGACSFSQRADQSSSKGACSFSPSDVQTNNETLCDVTRVLPGRGKAFTNKKLNRSKSK